MIGWGAHCYVNAQYELTLSGASKTRVMPAGPRLKQTARVTENGVPVPGTTVKIEIPGRSAISGVTNGSGELSIYYRPANFPTQDTVIASCSGCTPAQKAITVEAAKDESCTPVGNPLLPGLAAKVQTEATGWMPGLTL